MASYFAPKKNTAYITYVSLASVSNSGTFQANPTLATGDVKVSIDGGALANLTTLPVVTPAGSKLVKVSLSSAEMNGDNIAIVFSDAAGSEWQDLTVVLQPVTNQLDDLALATATTDIQARLPAALVSGRIDASVGAMAANVVTATAIATDAIGAAEIAADAVTKIQAGLATPTNITAGTITTVTNLTNAPSAGDLTATMKTSVTTAATAATPTAAAVTGNVGGNVVGSVGSLATQAKADVNAEADTALADVGVTTTVTGRIDAAISTRLATAGYTVAPSAASVASAILAATLEGAITVAEAQRIMLAVLAGKSAGGGTTTVTFRDVADAKNRISATVDSAGNRSAVTRDGT